MQMVQQWHHAWMDSSSQHWTPSCIGKAPRSAAGFVSITGRHCLHSLRRGCQKLMLMQLPVSISDYIWSRAEAPDTIMGDFNRCGLRKSPSSFYQYVTTTLHVLLRHWTPVKALIRGLTNRRLQAHQERWTTKQHTCSPLQKCAWDREPSGEDLDW